MQTAVYGTQFLSGKSISKTRVEERQKLESWISPKPVVV